MSEAGFKRIHRWPKAAWASRSMVEFTPRAVWLRKRSEERYLRRDDAYGLTAPLSGEIGTVECFRFITTTET